MDIYGVLSILGESLFSVCLFGTGLVVILAIITLFTKNEIMRKTSAMIGRLLLVLWIGQIAISVSYLMNGMK